ncbi:hypothetical protein [Jannaschia aquimarina]|uniref:Uncharacterized protein n=1 Tax=Jannaschia aquimarina TaxID=935700 RepID=A0A0D1EL46_9RHOB|nr:hypothetical protein [Jannaschia aquimarina]KIT16470.1 hypothetical protein jaqu_16980 [Jannaschia aquimarina]SNT07790.1 hypothetical protein SAMN05421775_105148 [Jannaschia aquimarina]
MIGALLWQVPLAMAAGWAVPRLAARVLPEGVGWLILNGAVSTVVLAGLAVVAFVWLYGEAGDVVWSQDPWHFVRLSASAAILWGPMMVLSLAGLPKRWKEVVW